MPRPHWAVYAKGAYADPQGIFKYLSRYTFRTAIGNERMIDQSGEQVSDFAT